MNISRSHTLLLLSLVFFAAPVGVCAQSAPSLPRSATDTSFAIRLALNEMQQSIQTGARMRSLVLDTAIQNAGRALRLARLSQHRAAPTSHANALWDFQIDVQDVRPAGANKWIVYATVSLASDTTSSSSNLSLIFSQTPQGLELADTRDLRAVLRAMSATQSAEPTP